MNPASIVFEAKLLHFCFLEILFVYMSAINLTWRHIFCETTDTISNCKKRFIHCNIPFLLLKCFFRLYFRYKNASNNYFTKNIVTARISSMQQHFVIKLICNSKLDSKNNRKLVNAFSHRHNSYWYQKILLIVTVRHIYKLFK